MVVANPGSNSAIKTQASDRTLLAAFTVAMGPPGLTLGGFDICVANCTHSTVSKLPARAGAHIGTYGPVRGLALNRQRNYRNTRQTYDALVPGTGRAANN